MVVVLNSHDEAQVLCGKAEYLANASRTGGTEPRHEPRSNARNAGRRLAAWLATPAGGRFLALERPPLQDTVRRFHGDSLLWIGTTDDLVDTTAQCLVRARIRTTCGSLDGRVSVHADSAAAEVDVVVADTAELPFAGASIDGVVLHHALDVVADRRGTLREAARVLRSGGRLVVVGFNPFSLWLLTRPLAAFHDLHPLSVPRLREWLAVLGMTREAPPVYLNYRSGLPIALAREPWRTASAWLNRLQPPLGGAYILAARKQGRGAILQQRDQRRRGRQLAPVAVPSATRQEHAP